MRFPGLERTLERPGAIRAGLAVVALALIAGFALAGPVATTGIAAILVAGIGCALLLPRPPLAALWPACGLLLLFPQVGPAIYVFDAVVGVALVATILWTWDRADERAWNLGPAGLLAAATLLVPLLAVPIVVASFRSFVGGYKIAVAFVIMFFALRRLVPRKDAQLLLWIGPLVGALASIQLLVRTAGVGAVSLQRLTLRNFHSNLGWGKSNYIAAILVFCMFLSALLLVLEKRAWARGVIVVACLLMLRSFVMLYSRTSTVALLVFFLFLIFARGGRTALTAGTAALVSALLFAVTPFGAVLLSRFTDPTELLSAKVRFDIWQSAIERFQRHPWTGVGLNQGKYQMDIMDVDHAHNTFLDYLSEQGVFGVAVYVALLVAIFRVAARVRVPSSKVDHRTIRALCLATTTAVVVNSMAEPTWNAYVYTMLLVYFLAWLTHNQPESA